MQMNSSSQDSWCGEAPELPQELEWEPGGCGDARACCREWRWWALQLNWKAQGFLQERLIWEHILFHPGVGDKAEPSRWWGCSWWPLEVPKLETKQWERCWLSVNNVSCSMSLGTIHPQGYKIRKSSLQDMVQKGRFTFLRLGCIY